MSKEKRKNYRVEDMKYSDGYGVDHRHDVAIDKRKSRCFERALKTKNYQELIHGEDDYDDEEEFAED